MIVSREAEELLKAYAGLIRKWNPAINLVAPGTLTDLERRHIQDSAQLYELARPQEGSWIDLGSGGGLPGIVVAILARDLPLTVTLVESDRRKSAFLQTCRRELNLSSLVVKSARIETLPESRFRFASARALASLQNLLPMLVAQLASNGEAWLLKGRSWKQEVEAAKAEFSFDLESFQSTTDPDSVVIKLRNIAQNG